MRNLSDNGLRWSISALLYSLFGNKLRGFGDKLESYMRRLEIKYRLPGTNTIENNYKRWESYCWEKGGNEWDFSLEWKQSLINDIMLKHFTPGSTILEIGPGAGRWTEPLQKMADRLIIVDLSPKCIEICKKRFRNYDNIEYLINQGTNLDFIPDQSVDFIWSFAVFTHLSPKDTDRYLGEINRILKIGGIGIISHPKNGGLHGGWRSSVTDKLFNELLKINGLKLIKQIAYWGKKEKYYVQITEQGQINDILSIFRK